MGASYRNTHFLINTRSEENRDSPLESASRTSRDHGPIPSSLTSRANSFTTAGRQTSSITWDTLRPVFVAMYSSLLSVSAPTRAVRVSTLSDDDD